MRNSFLLLASAAVAAACELHVRGASGGVTYRGVERDGLQHFYGIPYAQDTSGENRFKPPRPYVPYPGEIIDATKPGIACPQPAGQLYPPLGLGNITAVSEDCLNLNVLRPKPNGTNEKLPVMVWIHGGNFWWGSNVEPTFDPVGLVQQSVENGRPVIHVAMNYRLGFFGFAQSDSLKQEGSQNAGLRDQRAAIEWVRNYISAFGGDPENITIFGQSSGGLAIGMHILAYGGTKPLPFQRGIAQSQSLEPGITGNFTRDAMTALVDYIGCNTTSMGSPETVACLRSKDTEALLRAAIETYASDVSHNIGDIWMPTVDGDFLPAAPSQLIAEGRFGNATFMSGWTQDDLNYYTNTSITTAADTHDFMRAYLPAMPTASLNQLLALYPISEFSSKPNSTLTPEFYRSARIFRDILMVCPSLHLGAAMHKTYSPPVYHYAFNQTILDPILAAETDIKGWGVVHTSEFAYMFGSMREYNVSGYPFNPTASDYALLKRASRSWSSFAALGEPSLVDVDRAESDTLKGWGTAFSGEDEPRVMVVGGPWEGSWALGGSESPEVVQRQRLVERCAFLNDPEIIKALQY